MTPSDTVVRFFHDVDRRNWPALRAALSDDVDIDYTSLFGGSAEQISADQLLDRWKGLLPGFDSTHHLLGPLAPAPSDSGAGSDAAEHRLECNVQAHHRLVGAHGDADEWLVAGRYAITVGSSDACWRISAITLDTAYQSGNPGLVEVASARAADLP